MTSLSGKVLNLGDKGILRKFGIFQRLEKMTYLRGKGQQGENGF